MRTLVHPKMLARITAQFMTSLASIENYTPTTTANGEQVDSWTPDVSMTNIPCVVQTDTATELRDGFVAEVLTYRITLAGIWDVNTADRLTVDGVRFDLRGVAIDTHAPTTTLFARRVQ